MLGLLLLVGQFSEIIGLLDVVGVDIIVLRPWNETNYLNFVELIVQLWGINWEVDSTFRLILEPFLDIEN
jgi:hypothetical protein